MGLLGTPLHDPRVMQWHMLPQLYGRLAGHTATQRAPERAATLGATCLHASNHSFSAALKQELRYHVVCGRRARFVDTVGVADRDENCHAFTSAR